MDLVDAHVDLRLPVLLRERQVESFEIKKPLQNGVSWWRIAGLRDLSQSKPMLGVPTSVGGIATCRVCGVCVCGGAVIGHWRTLSAHTRQERHGLSLRRTCLA